MTLIERLRRTVEADGKQLPVNPDGPAAAGLIVELLAAARAAIAYDAAIRQCGNDPERMATFVTAQGDDLDDLYSRWMKLSVEAVASAVAHQRAVQ